MTITDKQLDDWWSDQSFDTKLVVRKLIAEVRRLREDNEKRYKADSDQMDKIIEEVNKYRALLKDCENQVKYAIDYHNQSRHYDLVDRSENILKRIQDAIE
jgi:hypothetical protein